MFYLSINQIKKSIQPEIIKETVPKHIQWIKQQITAGSIVQAGKWGETGGMCIIKAESKQIATDLMEEDPLIIAGISEMNLAEFYPDVPIK